MGLVSGLWGPLLAQEKTFYLEEWYASGDGALAPHSRQASAADALGSVYLASVVWDESVTVHNLRIVDALGLT